MSDLKAFWADLSERTEKARTVKTVAALLELFPRDAELGPTSKGFYEGDADDLLDALYDAGWRNVDVRAVYYWCLKAPEGEGLLSYVEGDLYEGNQLTPKES